MADNYQSTRINDEVDMLAFGAHPDDVEIGMGGTIYKYSSKGYKIAICDLTLAELSSNGNVEIRQREAALATEILQVINRVQLQIPDRGIQMRNDYILQLVRIIRQLKPKIVFAPYYEDRHPDHGNCARLVREAIFSASIRKYDESTVAHKVEAFYMYMINGFHKPSFVVDITEEMDIKLKALQAYESQFMKKGETVETPLNNDYLTNVEARERLFGNQVGVSYGEGFISEKPLLFYELLRENK